MRAIRRWKDLSLSTVNGRHIAFLAVRAPRSRALESQRMKDSAPCFWQPAMDPFSSQQSTRDEVTHDTSLTIASRRDERARSRFVE